MLPSSGQFKDIDCPYYNAVCGRPYCHFRHRRKNTDSAEETATEQQTVPTYNPTPKSQLANATGHLPISYVPDLVIRHERRAPLNYEKPTYKPTPKSILSSGVNPESNEYTPTAIIADSDTKIAVVDTEVDIGLDVENIDLEDLDTEFGIIDEILSDTSKVEEELLAETSEIATTKDLTKTRKSSKDDSSARKSSKSKHQSTKNSDSSSKHSNDTNKASSEKSKHKDKDSDNSSNHRNKDSGDKSNNKDKDSTDNGKHRDRDSEKSSHRDKDKTEEKKEKVRSKSRDKATDKEKHKDREKEKEKRKKEKSDCDKKASSGVSKKEKSSDRTKEKERKKDGDKEKDKDRGKRKSDSKTKSDRNHHSSSKSGKSKDKSDKLDIENVLNSWDDLNDDDNLADLCLDDRDEEENEDEATLEEECYKIFSEYKPTPIAELKQRITPNIEDTYIPEDIATLNTGKKRVAYESADRVAASLPSPAPPRYKPLATPAAVMADRLKKARQAASDNEQLRLASEMKRQELNSYNKRVAVSSEEYVPSSKVPRRTSTEDTVSKNKIKVRVARVPQGSALGPTAAKAKSSCLVDDIINGRGNSNSNLSASGSVKNPVKRIAPVMNMGGIQKAKARMDEINRAKAALALKTPAQTLNAGVHRHTQRVAHTPDITSSLSDLPDVVQAAHSKLPVNVRTRYLTLLADETCRLYVGRGAAHARALSEEAKCYERCKVLATYRNSAMLAVNRLRKEVKEREAAGLGPMLDGEEDDKSSTPTDNYHGATFHRLVSKYLLTPAELDLHSFPRPAPHGSSGAIFNTLSAHAAPVTSLAADQRNCARCHRNYLVDEENDGLAVYEQECVYHPLRKRTLRGDSRYLCCKGTDEQGGCVTAPAHVSNGKPAEVGVVQQGYQSTMPSTNTAELDPRDLQVYALDCEMCYTTHGLELTRVTIIDSDCRTVYESFVKPLHPIIDYNTRFSGITREQMDRTSTSILQVQANILHLCTDSTILIGHSLESDMKALKIVHGNVVDTSVMFPHKFGLPAKRALRQLASEYLQLIIQNDAEGGHDSAEDARACMELVRWKIREDLKVKGIKQAK